jgi:hypothetical protein
MDLPGSGPSSRFNRTGVGVDDPTIIEPIIVEPTADRPLLDKAAT